MKAFNIFNHLIFPNNIKNGFCSIVNVLLQLGKYLAYCVKQTGTFLISSVILLCVNIVDGKGFLLIMSCSLTGILACLDGYMNIAMEQTEEYVNGQLKNKYGDAFIRGNNGKYKNRQNVSHL
jgi:hypothetical protein